MVSKTFCFLFCYILLHCSLMVAGIQCVQTIAITNIMTDYKPLTCSVDKHGINPQCYILASYDKVAKTVKNYYHTCERSIDYENSFLQWRDENSKCYVYSDELLQRVICQGDTDNSNGYGTNQFKAMLKLFKNASGMDLESLVTFPGYAFPTEVSQTTTVALTKPEKNTTKSDGSSGGDAKIGDTPTSGPGGQETGVMVYPTTPGGSVAGMKPIATILPFVLMNLI